MQRLALLSLPLALSLAACAHTETRRRTVDRGTVRVEGGAPLPDGNNSPVAASLSVSGRVVQGTVAWGTTCRPRFDRQKEHVMEDRHVPEIGNNLLWTVAGAGFFTGGGYLLATGVGGSTREQATRVPPGLALAIGGLFVAGTALHTQLSPRLLYPPSSSIERTPEPGPGLVPCGHGGKPPPYRLGLRLASGLTLPAEQQGQHLGLVLPAGTVASSAEIVVLSGGDELARDGQTLGSITLSMAPLPPDPPVGRFVAEQASVTRACSPQGRDQQCDGKDRDCDGFYDVGCGRAVGSLQWTLLPSTEPLVLWVTGPDGHEVMDLNRGPSPSGITLEAPCQERPGEHCEGGVQNAFVPLGRQPDHGTYLATVVARETGRRWLPQRIPAVVVGRAGGAWYRVGLVLEARRHHRAAFAFAVGPDRDGDAVIDSEDVCPDEPGPHDHRAARRGCPPRPPPKR